MIRIAVIGTVVDDEIRRPDGSVHRDLGGIVYAVGALSALGGDAVEVVPITRATDDLRPRLERAWSSSPNIDLSHLVATRGSAPRVVVTYGGGEVKSAAVGGDRHESLHRVPPPLEPPHLEAALTTDAVLINCITGFDLRVESAEWLAARVSAVHLDLHSLLLGRAEDGARYPSRPSTIDRWAALASTLQGNDAELELASGGTPLRQWVHPLHSGGLQALVRSRGAAGAELYPATGDRVDVSAPCLQAVDPTGAGDVLGATFVLALVRGESPEAALRRAVIAASVSCQFSGPGELAGLPERILRLRT